MSALHRSFVAILLFSTTAFGQDGAHPLSGDASSVQGFEDQRNVQIAAGGSGYLVVWEDDRTVLGPYINAGYEPLLGNQRDIYAARLDDQGNPLDAEPIVVCNLGRMQKLPQVAWNGTHWLVVFVSERPDWYFFEDIVGVRIAPDGAVVDSTPIAIRPELNSPANYQGMNPTVLGRNGDWIVVWEDWNPANGFPSIKGTRVSGAGVVLDPAWPTLQEHNVAAFGPRGPRIVALGNELLLVWLELNQGMRYRRISNALAPLAAPALISGLPSSIKPQVASDGNVAFLMAGLKGFRVGAGGALLDPTGITISTSNFNSETTPTVAWNGSSFSTTWSISPGGTFVQPNDVYLARVSSTGVVLDSTPITAAGTTAHERLAAISGKNGATQFAYLVRNSALQEDVHAVRVDAGGSAGVPRDVSTGRRRQEYAQLATIPGGIAVTFASRASESSRVLLTRVAADGSPLDAEPVIVAEGAELWSFRPDVAFDGQRLLVVWNDPSGSVVAQRYSLSLQPIDPAPFVVFPAAGTPTVAGSTTGFLVGATWVFSGDQNQLQAKRVSGDGIVIDASPLVVGGDWVENPTFTAFTEAGGAFLAVWTRRPTHDSPASSVHARIVNPDGSFLTSDLIVSTNGGGDFPDVAVLGDRALLVWTDDVLSTGDRIEGRLLSANGALIGTDIVIDDEAFHQSFPTATTDGARFLVAWVDYRDQLPIEQLRGDIFAARVGLDGSVLDPTGVRVTSGGLPEDLPRLATAAGIPRAFWLDLRSSGGGSDHVQRIVHREIGSLLPGPWQNLGFGKPGQLGTPSLFGSGTPTANSLVTLTVDNGAPLANAWFIAGGARVDLPFFGGVLVPTPSVILPAALDADGRLAFGVVWPTGLPSGVPIHAQAWIADPTATFGLAATNGLSITQP